MDVCLGALDKNCACVYKHVAGAEDAAGTADGAALGTSLLAARRMRAAAHAPLRAHLLGTDAGAGAGAVCVHAAVFFFLIFSRLS